MLAGSTYAGSEMNDFADPQRRGTAGLDVAPSAVAEKSGTFTGAFEEAGRTAVLAATGRLLNARPALVAQRAVADTLARRPRGMGAVPPPRASAAPVQLMNNGAPPDEDEWGPFQGGGGQQVGDDEWGPFQGAGDQQIGEDEWGPFQGAGDQQIGEDEWGPFQGAGNHGAAAIAAVPAPNPHAGHGLEVAIGGHAAANGPMYTTSLYNCIALVAYDPQAPLACLYHWNTAVGAFEMDEGVEDEDGEMHYELVPSPGGIVAARAVVDGGAPGAAAYHAVLGTSWGDAELAPRRAAFEAALTAAMPGITISADPRRSARWVAPDLIGY